MLDPAYAEKTILPLLNLNDRLHELLVGTDIKLSSIVAMGNQSDGKTSVLEAISRISLPRGSGLITKRPLEMQLRNSLNGEEFAYIWEHDQEKTRIAVSDIENWIRDLSGNGEIISHEIIHLIVYLRGYLDMTIIDLPGLVANNAAMPAIGAEIEKLYRKYLKPENIILNIITCDTDAAAKSIPMNWSHEVDKDHKHTILCFTKPDAYESVNFEQEIGKAAASVDPAIPEKMIFVLKNRVSGDKPIEEARKEEEDYFREHGQFKLLANRIGLGVKKLEQRLVALQSEVIIKSLPRAEQEIEQTLVKLKLELNRLPTTFKDEGAASLEFQKKISDLRSAFHFEQVGGPPPKGYDISEERDFLRTSTIKILADLRKQLSNHQPVNYFFGGPDSLLYKKLVALTLVASNLVLFPDSIPQEVPSAILRKLKEDMETIIYPFVNEMSQTVSRVMEEWIKMIAAGFPTLTSMLLLQLHKFLDKMKAEAFRDIDRLILFEKAENIIIDRALWMRTAKYMCDYMYRGSDEDTVAVARRFIDVYDTEFLSNFSNGGTIDEDQEDIVEMQIKIYIYWKHMIQRLTDYSILAISTAFNSSLTEDSMVNEIQQEFLSFDPMALMSFSEESKMERDSLTIKIKTFEEARDEIVRAKTKTF
jgi:hypothetical protein